MISDVVRMLQQIDIAVSTWTIDSKLAMLSSETTIIVEPDI